LKQEGKTMKKAMTVVFASPPAWRPVIQPIRAEPEVPAEQGRRIVFRRSRLNRRFVI
jgi:hypothetical protein